MKRKILVVGQTPPPFHGQAIMIEAMLRGEYKRLTLFHVRMAFSKDLNEVGNFNLFKVFHLFSVILKIIFSKFRHGIDTLYFPPTGPKLIAFYRDAFILVMVRPLFKTTYFHFHAGGISELYPKLGLISRFLFRRAYFNADLGIQLSLHSPNDCILLKTKRRVIIPNGISDNNFSIGSKIKGKGEGRLLFVGLLSESKGFKILVEACHILANREVKFSLDVLGKFESAQFESEILRMVKVMGLESHIVFHGVVTGDDKFSYYANSQIFCFPSFYEAESFPVVLLEACSFGMPIVTTKWRGIPSIVEDGVNGYLTEVKSPETTADKLEILIRNPELITTMGEASRKIFVERYTIDQFLKSIENAFVST